MCKMVVGTRVPVVGSKRLSMPSLIPIRPVRRESTVQGLFSTGIVGGWAMAAGDTDAGPAAFWAVACRSCCCRSARVGPPTMWYFQVEPDLSFFNA